jgi:hypothetical protein
MIAHKLTFLKFLFCLPFFWTIWYILNVELFCISYETSFKKYVHLFNEKYSLYISKIRNFIAMEFICWAAAMYCTVLLLYTVFPSFFTLLLLYSLENQEYGCRDLLCWPGNTMYPQKLALTSPTSDGRLVSIVCSRAKAVEFVCLFVFTFTVHSFRLKRTESQI